MLLTHVSEDRRDIFYLSGGMAFSDHAAFRVVLDAIRERRTDCLEIDLTEVNFIDSAGLGLLLLAREEAQQTNMTLTLRNPRGQVRKIFDLSEFHRLFSITP